MTPDSFEVPAAEAQSEIKVTRSTFLAIAFPATTEEEFRDRLTAIEKQFFDATHHCWAFRLLGEGQSRSRSSDAGEPSGTAGRPILNAIEASDLQDVAVVVVRYYGGTKLGTGGLARAYRDAATGCLASVPRLRKFLYERITIEVPFAQLNTVYRLVAPPDVVLVTEKFEEKNHFVFDVRLSIAEAFRQKLASERLLTLT